MRARPAPVRYLIAAAALAAWLLPAAAALARPDPRPAQLPRVESQRVETVDQIGGLVPAAAPQGDGTAIMAEGPALVHLALNADGPRILARRDLGHGLILDLAQEGGVYAALTEEGIVTLAGLGNDGLPQIIGFAPGGGQRIALEGGVAAVAARGAGLRALVIDDVENRGSGAVLPLDGEAVDVALTPGGGLAYVAAGARGVHVVDLSDPSAPRLERTLPVAPADAVGLAGALLVVGSGARALAVDPASGVIVGTYAPLGDGVRIAAQDDYLFVADANDGLKVYWVANESRIVQVYGEADRPARDMLMDGDRITLIGEEGLRVLDAGSRFRPLELARFDLPGDPQGIAAAPERYYVALGTEGVGVVDAANLSRMRLVRRIPLAGEAQDVIVHGDALYAALGDGGLAVIDLSGRETLRETFILPGPALDLALRGDILLVASGESGLIAIDVTQPFAPTLAGTLSAAPGESIESATVDGKRAYVAAGDHLIVVDVSHPAAMGRLARIDGPAAQAALADDVLSIAGAERLSRFDVSATADPIPLGTYAGMSGPVTSVAAQAARVYLSGGGDGPALVVVSFQTPDFPTEEDHLIGAGEAGRAWPADGEVWLARGYGGLSRHAVSEGGALAPLGAYRVFGEAARLALDGERLLAGGRGGWAALEVNGTPLSAPLGQSADAPPVRALVAVGDVVAVAAGDAGVALYRMGGGGEREPLAAQTGQGSVIGVAMTEDFVLAADAGGLALYDRRYLVPVTRVQIPAPPTDLVLRGRLAYLPLADGRIAVIDVADPTGGLRTLSRVETRRPADLIPGPEGRVYTLADDQLNRLWVDDPGALRVSTGGDLRAVAQEGMFAGNHLWALTPGEAARVYDPARIPEFDPDFEREVETAAVALDLDPATGIAYAAYGEDGLGWFDMGRPTTGGTFYTGDVRALYRAGGMLFALGRSLTAWDLGQPAEPALLAELPLVAPGSHIAPLGETDLLLSLESGLAVVRWDGNMLETLGQIVTPGAVDRAAALDGRAYAALHDGGLLAVDVSDPAAPEALYTAASESGRFVRDLLPLDGRTLLVSWEGGIDALDVSGASDAPRLVDVYEIGARQAHGLTFAADGQRAALATGEGVLLLDFGGDSPQVIGFAGTPGEAARAALAGDTLYVADGVCGLRVIDVADPATPRERGYWQRSVAADVVPGPNGTIYLAEANQLMALRYDPDAPAVRPPMPQFPQPADGLDGAPLALELAWGPTPDPCNPLAYSVYLGPGENPPFTAQVTGAPALQIVELEPLRTYQWYVEAVDRQGDTIQGPVWRFTTAPADFPDNLPPAPPLMVERLRENPAVPVALGTLLAAALILGLIALRRRGRRR